MQHFNNFIEMAKFEAKLIIIFEGDRCEYNNKSVKIQGVEYSHGNKN